MRQTRGLTSPSRLSRAAKWPMAGSWAVVGVAGGWVLAARRAMATREAVGSIWGHAAHVGVDVCKLLPEIARSAPSHQYTRYHTPKNLQKQLRHHCEGIAATTTNVTNEHCCDNITRQQPSTLKIQLRRYSDRDQMWTGESKWERGSPNRA